MSIKDQLINDIKLLPDHTLQAVSIIVREIVTLNAKEKEDELEEIRQRRADAFGSMKGKIWMSDDFDAPLEDMREYME